MEKSELLALITSIRNGRDEDQCLEMKRQWWNFKIDQSKQEFRKDVSALANSCQGEGHILIGLKEGKLFDAPKPCDEAELQEILKEATPPPNVHFQTHEIEEQGQTLRVSVVTVTPSFDRPYVTKDGAQNLVYVRKGSGIRTATRFDLDSFYKSTTPLPKLGVTWSSWNGLSHKSTDGPLSKELLIFAPYIHNVEEYLGERLSQYKKTARETGYPTSGQVAEYESKFSAFLESLNIRANMAYWYEQRAKAYYHQNLSLALSNEGTKPATDVKVRIQLPEWIYIPNKNPTRPDGYMQEPFIPQQATPKPAQESNKNRYPSPSPLNIPIFNPIIADAALREPTESAWTDKQRNVATFWTKRVRHAHTLRLKESVRILALPTAPEIDSEELLNLEIFCEEYPDWESRSAKIKIVKRA